MAPGAVGFARACSVGAGHSPPAELERGVRRREPGCAGTVTALACNGYSRAAAAHAGAALGRPSGWSGRSSSMS